MPDWRYAPDLPPDTPNIWTACDGFHPDVYGNYRTGWLPATPTFSVVGGGAAVGGSVSFQHGFVYLTNSGSITTGLCLIHNPTTGQSTGKAYVFESGSWTRLDNSTNVVKGTCFAQMGATTLVGTPVNGLFSRTSGNNFAAVASSPNAGVLLVNPLNIVIALDADSGGASGSDGWATSDTNAPTTWSGGESSSGNLYHTPGVITAGAVLGNDVIAAKSRGIYRGTYVGGTLKWLWTLIDPQKGAWGPGSMVSMGSKVAFIGNAGAYVFDGSTFERIDDGIWRQLVSTFALYTGSIADGDAIATKLVWDAANQNIYFFRLGVPSLQSGRENAANVFFSYNVISKKWGYQSKLSETGSSNTLDAVFDISAGNIPIGSSNAGSYVSNTNVGFFSSTNDKVQILSTSFNATGLPGTNYKPKLRTYRVGQRNKLTSVTRFTPEWTKSDGAGSDLSTATVKTVTPYTSNALMASETAGTAATLSSNQYRADYTVTAPFQSAEININCEAVISGGIFDAQPAGTI